MARAYFCNICNCDVNCGHMRRHERTKKHISNAASNEVLRELERQAAVKIPLKGKKLLAVEKTPVVNFNKKFNCYDYISNINYISSVEEWKKEILSLLPNIKGNDLVRLYIYFPAQGGYNSYHNSTKNIKFSELDYNSSVLKLLNRVEKALTSADQVFIDLIRFQTRVIVMPEGAGRSKPTLKNFNSKTSVNIINNSDDLCGLRAIVVGLTYHKEKFLEVFPEFSECNGKELKNTFSYIRGGRVIQTTLSEALKIAHNIETPTVFNRNKENRKRT
jgi:hypothetical protein